MNLYKTDDGHGRIGFSISRNLKTLIETDNIKSAELVGQIGVEVSDFIDSISERHWSIETSYLQAIIDHCQKRVDERNEWEKTRYDKTQ